MTLRLGIVPYLNVLPLLEGLEAHIPAANWVRATPRELAGLLASGEIDVATLPVFEALRATGYSIVPGCAIGCRGSVRSVQLFSNVPLYEIRTVLLDRSSLTSVHLARILLADLCHIKPVYTTSDAPIAVDFDLPGSGFDAAVVIGDVALQWDSEKKFTRRLDFGEAWQRLTGLPFVFAAWVARPGAQVSAADITAFQSARSAGERNVAAIAARESLAHGTNTADLESYLRDSIRFALGEEELAGMREFHRRLIAHGLLGDNPFPEVLRDIEVGNHG